MSLRQEKEFCYRNYVTIEYIATKQVPLVREENREDREGCKNPETTRSRHCNRGDAFSYATGLPPGRRRSVHDL